jgi:DNA-binding NarL/FixJ family response regulator
MRAILVGTPHDRARLRSQLDRALIEIVAEFPTVAGVRRSEVDFDAIIMAEPEPGRRTSLDLASDAGPPVEPLTGREIQVLELMAEGLPNKAIAVELGISDQTVKFHVSSIAGKLGAANRTDAVRRAVRRGLIAL